MIGCSASDPATLSYTYPGRLKGPLYNDHLHKQLNSSHHSFEFRPFITRHCSKR